MFYNVKPRITQVFQLKLWIFLSQQIQNFKRFPIYVIRLLGYDRRRTSYRIYNIGLLFQKYLVEYESIRFPLILSKLFLLNVYLSRIEFQNCLQYIASLKILTQKIICDV